MYSRNSIRRLAGKWLKMVEKMRDSDYIGIMEDDQLYVLLANTGQENAVIVQKRFEENGYRTEIVE